MEFWIIINGKAQGPYGVDEMLRRGATPSTPVWRQGMTEWVPAATVRELADYFADGSDGQAPGYTTPPPSPAVQTVTPIEPQQANAYNPYAAQGRQPSPELPPMPSTYLGWNIAATLLCCIPAGIVGIIYSAMVRSKYSIGDYEGAAKASSRASLWLIISIVVGIIWGVCAVALNIVTF